MKEFLYYFLQDRYPFFLLLFLNKFLLILDDKITLRKPEGSWYKRLQKLMTEKVTTWVFGVRGKNRLYRTRIFPKPRGNGGSDAEVVAYSSNLWHKFSDSTQKCTGCCVSNCSIGKYIGFLFFSKHCSDRRYFWFK